MTGRYVPPAPSRRLVLGSALAGVGATALVAVVDPHQGGRYPTCPLLAATGLYCPFCGGLRAVHDLVHLDPVAALGRNPLVVAVVPLAVLAWVVWAQRAFTGRRLLAAPSWAGAAVLGVFLVFGVLRNVPGWSWLSPA